MHHLGRSKHTLWGGRDDTFSIIFICGLDNQIMELWFVCKKRVHGMHVPEVCAQNYIHCLCAAYPRTHYPIVCRYSIFVHP